MAKYTIGSGIIAWNFGNSGAEHGYAYTCGYCGTKTSAVALLRGRPIMEGKSLNGGAYIRFCPVCLRPTFFDTSGDQTPAVRLGAELSKVPSDGLKQLYDEARDCSAAGAHTACVMVCRKILMNLAVREGAQAGKSFKEYVAYLEDQHFIPPKGEAWVDKIRDKGNEANHEIAQMTQTDASQILHLVEMLLRFNFELGTPNP